jgi:alkyl hydroperoxide reductase subunit AhpC
LIGLSVDRVDRKDAWADEIEATQGHRPNFPVIAD